MKYCIKAMIVEVKKKKEVAIEKKYLERKIGRLDN